jgi:hypothetical protein
MCAELICSSQVSVLVFDGLWVGPCPSASQQTGSGLTGSS